MFLIYDSGGELAERVSLGMRRMASMELERAW